ncbi:hypothetical protein [Azospirillum sp. BE72]|uniref:hypothetical protein n=1 Tax=Azospirillum sp. BE72 TaxID=2817776 RepID=UPI0028565D53|nr:hypothetical protein [Azospirillum sp. BE72]MDR6775644.1 hypothetical protein [Azospirillum sp. BE72]
MTSKPIPTHIKVRLNAAKSSSVSSGLSRVLPAVESGEWLPPSHSYRRISDIERDASSGSIKSKEYTEHIAVSAPLHSMDGWRYLSGSLGALIHGDYHGARHMAYYAELRAALSILASAGIGISNGWNYAIDGSGKCTRIDASTDTEDGYGTHKMVWMAFEHWITSSDAKMRIGKVIQLRNHPLSTILYQHRWQAQIPHWLNLWGLDIRRYASERDARNLSSYEPTDLNRISITWEETCTFLAEFWGGVDAGGTNTFDNVDKHLIRIALRDSISENFDEDSYDESFSVDNFISQEVGNALRTMPGAVSPVLTPQFLQRLTEPDDLAIIRYAKKTSGAEAHPFSMISRAFLLLRISSGISNEFVKQVGARTLGKWLERVTLDAGLAEIWDENNPYDLLTEVFNTISDIEPHHTNRYLGFSNCAAALCLARQAERIGVLAFCD